jgi:hypothetical protein
LRGLGKGVRIYWITMISAQLIFIHQSLTLKR